MPALKVVGLDDSKKAKTSTVYVKVNSTSSDLAAVVGSSRMKATSRQEETSTEAANQLIVNDNFDNNSAVPKANTYDNAGAQRITAANAATPDNENINDRSRNRRFRNYGYVSAEPETTETNNMGRPLESSYTAETPALATYEDAATDKFVAGTSLVPADKAETAKTADLRGRDLLMANNTTAAPKTEAAVPSLVENNNNVNTQQLRDVVADKIQDRSRDRNLRGFAAEQHSAATEKQYEEHSVKVGETLESILKLYPNCKLETLLEDNQLKADATLKVGQVLKIKKD